jgi:phosphatidylserine/phosphatidylglycerophosphate/cardiolipin synthase-like enzyme
MKRLCVLFALSACATSDDSPPPTDEQPVVDAPPAEDFCNATDPRTVPIEVVATPEAGEAPYTSVLATAQTSIDVEVYLMGYGGILDLLQDKARAGVRVRVILDGGKKDTNQKYFDLLVAAGAEVKWSDPKFSFFHAKFFVVDGKTAVMSTGNYSKTFSIERERNFVATDSDPADVADLVTLFEADWTGQTPAMSCTRMVISPVNSRERLLAAIAGAQATLDLESMQFADYAVRDAVKKRVQAGVQVRALLADANWIDANASAATFLKDLGVPVKWIPHLHTKMFVVDGKVAYVGSENFSQTSLDKNREVGVILVESSSIAPLASTFDKDWAVGTDF